MGGRDGHVDRVNVVSSEKVLFKITRPPVVRQVGCRGGFHRHGPNRVPRTAERNHSPALVVQHDRKTHH